MHSGALAKPRAGVDRGARHPDVGVPSFGTPRPRPGCCPFPPILARAAEEEAREERKVKDLEDAVVVLDGQLLESWKLRDGAVQPPCSTLSAWSRPAVQWHSRSREGKRRGGRRGEQDEMEQIVDFLSHCLFDWMPLENNAVHADSSNFWMDGCCFVDDVRPSLGEGVRKGVPRGHAGSPCF